MFELKILAATLFCPVFAESFRLGHWGGTDAKLEDRISTDYNGEGQDVPVYVFLQKFPLLDTNGSLFHTEVLVCPKSEFDDEDHAMLSSVLSKLNDFVAMEESWWSDKVGNCVELGYGGNECTTACCSVPHTDLQKQYPMNARASMIGNADVTQKSVYLYGEGSFDGNAAYHALCDHKCWSTWAGTDYNIITNNCNTFTSTVLSCVYGLSEKKPNLGISDLVNVKCKNQCKAAEESAPADEEIARMLI